MKWFKDNLHLILGALLISIVLGVIGNAVYEGYVVIVTQEKIDDSYRIHR